MVVIFNFVWNTLHPFVSRQSLYAWFLWGICSLSFPASVFSDTHHLTIFFYSSETHINNFKSLKMEFDNYLKGHGPYKFQPFSDRNAFENHIRHLKEYLVFLSSWHFMAIHQQFGLIPVLTGVRDGNIYQKRILVTGKRFADNRTPLKGPIASASSVPHTRSELAKMYPSDIPLDNVRILTVPKDIDALMSVSFFISKAALVTENAMDNLSLFDPILHREMKIISTGEDSLLLILSKPQGASAETDKIVEIIKNLQNDPVGMRINKMLDLDGWETMHSEDVINILGR